MLLVAEPGVVAIVTLELRLWRSAVRTPLLGGSLLPSLLHAACDLMRVVDIPLGTHHEHHQSSILGFFSQLCKP